MSSYVHPRSVCIAVLAASIATSSCGGGGGGGGTSTPNASAPPPAAPIVPARPVSQGNLEIAETLYTGAPRTPAGFYTEVAPTGHEFVSTEHLKNSDVDAAGPSEPLYELCTDDWNQALAWSELAAQDESNYSDLVETNDDSRYFEFGRTRASEPEFYVRDRVFKCSYVDRATADLSAPEGPAGLLNVRPLSASDLRTLSEYLWSFTTYNNFGSAVLKSSGASSEDSFSHSLYIASLTRDGISSECDRIDVLEWRHTVDAASGALTLDVETAFSFGAKDNGGAAELCSG